MRVFFKKFFEIENKISSEKGDFSLFGLFQRETSLPNRWDVVLAAPWFGENEVETLNYLFGKFRENLTPEEMVMISTVVLLKPDEQFVQEIAESVRAESGKTGLSDFEFNGMTITQGVIISPKRLEKRKAA